jgi:hypothetical protein
MNSSNSNAPVYLIGFAEALAAPEVCFSLQATGAQVKSFYRLEKMTKFARLNFVEYCPVTAPETDFNRTVHDIEALIRRFRPQLMAACDDAALLVLSRIGGSGDHCLAPIGAACDFAIDKWAQINAASASGFAVIRTRLVTSEGEVARFQFRPAILKPRAALDICGTGLDKGRAFMIHDDSLSEEARKAIARRPYLIQEYKDGVGEGYFGIAHAGKVYASFGHRRVRMMNPAGSGASACISRELDADESHTVEAFVKRTRWKGPFMVELLRDDFGRKWFMEFNGRFWGSLALARRCGLDMPRLAFDLASGKNVVIPSQIGPGFARHLGRDLIHLLFVLRGPDPGPRPHNWPARLRTLKEIVYPHALRSFYNYNPSQPFFFLKDAAITVSNAIFGRRT